MCTALVTKIKTASLKWLNFLVLFQAPKYRVKTQPPFVLLMFLRVINVDWAQLGGSSAGLAGTNHAKTVSW